MPDAQVLTEKTPLSAPPPAPVAAQPIAFAKIHPSPLNPRKHFAPERIADLAASIATQGILQNLVVRPHPKKAGEFEIVAGESRWRAVRHNIEASTSRKDGLFTAETKLPAVVRAVSDTELIELALTENVHRGDLTPIEEANAYLALFEKKVTVETIAQRASRSIRHVQMRMNLVRRLSPKVRKALDDGKLSVRQAEMFMFGDKERQDDVLDDVLRDLNYGEPVTADQIKESMTEEAIDIRYARFPIEQYKGEIIEDPDDPKIRYFVDVGQFEKLQAAARDAKKAELEKEHGDKLVVKEAQYGFRQGPTGKPSLPYGCGFKECGKNDPQAKVLLLTYGDDFHVFPAVKRQTDGESSAPTRSSSGGPKPKTPEFTQAFAMYCDEVRSHALQAAVASDPDVALRCACLALLGNHEVVRFQFPYMNFLTAGAALAKLAAPSRKLLAEVIEKAGDGDGPGTAPVIQMKHALRIGDKGADVYRRLCKLSRKDLEQLFAVLIGGRVFDFDFGGRLGASEIARAIATDAKVDMAKAWTVDRPFLDKCRKPQLLRICRDVGVMDVVNVPDVPMSRIKDALIAEPAKLAGYTPPWVKFASEAEIKADRAKSPPLSPGAEFKRQKVAKKRAAKAKAKAAAKATAKKAAKKDGRK